MRYLENVPLIALIRFYALRYTVGKSKENNILRANDGMKQGFEMVGGEQKKGGQEHIAQGLGLGKQHLQTMECVDTCGQGVVISDATLKPKAPELALNSLSSSFKTVYQCLYRFAMSSMTLSFVELPPDWFCIDFV